MLTGTVTKNDKVWQGHPDVAFFKGKFYVVYRESKDHKSYKNTKINIVSSANGSQYSAPTILLRSDKERWNCPRLSVVGNKMWLVCDKVKRLEDSFIKSENNPKAISIWVMSTKDGINWSEPFKTNINGIVPDRMFMSDDHFFIGVHRYKPGKTTKDDGRLVQSIWKTNNIKSSWNSYEIANMEGLNLCEGSICKIDDGRLACIMRENSGEGRPAYISFSKDGGQNWTIAEKTKFFGCHRPVLGKLKSGEYFATYREQSFSMHAAYWAKNTFACLIKERSLWKKPYCSHSIILPLDHDSNRKSDGGYTGWVQLPNDNIYVVNYITDDAPKPYIKWYLLNEEEF